MCRIALGITGPTPRATPADMPWEKQRVFTASGITAPWPATGCAQHQGLAQPCAIFSTRNWPRFQIHPKATANGMPWQKKPLVRCSREGTNACNRFRRAWSRMRRSLVNSQQSLGKKEKAALGKS